MACTLDRAFMNARCTFSKLTTSHLEHYWPRYWHANKYWANNGHCM